MSEQQSKPNYQEVALAQKQQVLELASKEWSMEELQRLKGLMLHSDWKLWRKYLGFLRRKIELEAFNCSSYDQYNAMKGMNEHQRRLEMAEVDVEKLIEGLQAQIKEREDNARREREQREHEQRYST